MSFMLNIYDIYEDISEHLVNSVDYGFLFVFIQHSEYMLYIGKY